MPPSSSSPAKAQDPRLPKKLLFIAIGLLILFAFAELLTYASGRFLQSKYRMYAVPVVPQQSETTRSYADYLKVRDPRLGWPYRVNFGGSVYDSSGARNSPAFPDPAASANAIALFGDSFAYGAEVDDEHAWGNQLARQIGARVGNFGVPGYGTDQAYLRFLSMDKDPAPVVILTHLSEDIVRMLTRDWDLLQEQSYYDFKPRFVLNPDGSLREVPLPNVSEQEYRHSVGIETPVLPMEYENFQPGGAAGATRLSFPFTLALLRNLGSYQMRALFARRPDYMEFYQRGHPLHGLEISAKIFEAFSATARQRGKTPLVILLANRQDIGYFHRTHTWTYANLVQALDAAHVDYIDFGPTLLSYIGDRPIPDFFAPLGHYNDAVNKLLADTVHAALRSRNLVPR